MWDILLFQEFENKCFYCGKPVTTDSVEVDHFIPWSFIKDDKLWNFVLACPKCNNQKRDKLADTIFLERLAKRNELIIMQPSAIEMRNYQTKRLVSIYSWAQKNGYQEIWCPRKKTRSDIFS